MGVRVSVWVGPGYRAWSGAWLLYRLTNRHGLQKADGEIRERAVKVLRPGATSDTMADFLREAEILQKLDHVNVVKLHGVCLREKPWLLMEENVVYVACAPATIVLAALSSHPPLHCGGFG